MLNGILVPFASWNCGTDPRGIWPWTKGCPKKGVMKLATCAEDEVLTSVKVVSCLAGTGAGAADGVGACAPALIKASAEIKGAAIMVPVKMFRSFFGVASSR